MVQERITQFGVNVIGYNGHGYGLQDGLNEHITNTTNFGIIASIKRPGDGNEYLQTIFNKLDNKTYMYLSGKTGADLDFKTTSSADIALYDFEKLVNFFEYDFVKNLQDFIQDICNQLNISSYVFYLPEVKNTIGDFGNKDHSINEADGIYIVGDSGISKTRGIVPAAISGLSVCSKI